METNMEMFADRFTLVDKLYVLMRENPRGFTVTFDGEVPRVGYVVSQFGSERSMERYGHTDTMFVEFADTVLRARDKVLMSENLDYSYWVVGGIVDDDRDRYILDIGRIFNDCEQAIEYGNLNDQDSIYSCSTDSLIYLSKESVESVSTVAMLGITDE